MFEKRNSVSFFPSEIERQARIERSLVRGACVRGVMRAFARGLRVLPARGIRLLCDLATKRLLRRQDLLVPHRLDDRTLADIGVTRGGDPNWRYVTGCPPANYVSKNWDSLNPQPWTA